MSRSSPVSPSPVAVPGVVVDMRLPQLRELATRLRFAPDEGRIWMDERRMVLLQAEAFSDLRTELIAALGMDTARHLLTRIYYAAGRRDAERVLKLLGPQASLREILDTGGRMHALQGYLLPEHVGRGLAAGDLRSDDYHGEAIWKDSLEDDVHIAQYGIGSDAACWNAIGYCSGYLSRCADRMILVRETECRASGSAHCKIVAKPASKWEDAAEDLRFLRAQPEPAARVFVPAAAETPERTAQRGGSAAGRPQAAGDAPGFIGVSAASSVLLHKLERVASTQATVLLLGESGVGKSLIAREVHRLSERAHAPFVEVNCAAIPESLLESELFGVERGAYSGATLSRPGRFEVAHGGTLFLDEVATLSMTAQGKLLRVLQSGALERLGSTRTITTDARLIAATNEDLKQAVREGRFREDLYFRLNVFPIVVPPLRERRDDIPLLVEVLLQRFAQRHGRHPTGVSARAMHALVHHHWPGNVRELENVLERGVIMLQGRELLDMRHLSHADDTLATPAFFGINQQGRLTANTAVAGEPVDDGDDAAAPAASVAPAPAPTALAEQWLQQGQLRLAEIEDALVQAALRQTRGNVTRAAALLGLTRAQLDYRQKKAADAGVRTATRRPRTG